MQVQELVASVKWAIEYSSKKLSFDSLEAPNLQICSEKIKSKRCSTVSELTGRDFHVIAKLLLFLQTMDLSVEQSQ